MGFQNNTNNNVNTYSNNTSYPVNQNQASPLINITTPPAPNYMGGYQNEHRIVPVTSEQDASMLQLRPGEKYIVGFNENTLTSYVKFADGGPIETYQWTLVEPPTPPKPVTAEEIAQIFDSRLNIALDQRFNDFQNSLDKRYQFRNKGGGMNNA